MGNDLGKLNFQQRDKTKSPTEHTQYDPSTNIIDQAFKYGSDEYTCAYVYVHNVMYSIHSRNNNYVINGMMILQSGIVLTTIETLFTDILSIDNFFKEMHVSGFVDGIGLWTKQNNFTKRYEVTPNDLTLFPINCTKYAQQLFPITCTKSLQLDCYMCCKKFCFNHIGKTICGLDACFACVNKHNKLEHTKCVCDDIICSEFKDIYQLCQLCNKPSHKRKTIEIKSCKYCNKSDYSSIETAGLTYYNPEHTLVCCDCANQSYNTDDDIKSVLMNYTILPNEMILLIGSYTKIFKINNFICEFCDNVICYKHYTEMIDRKTAGDYKYHELCKNTMEIADSNDQMLFCPATSGDPCGEWPYYESIPSKTSCRNCHNKLCRRKFCSDSPGRYY